MKRLAPVILVVEDEFLLRRDSADTIESAGFEVIQAANADEAIAILKARPDMGSMDGLKLARFVRDRWPPIVATSGHVTVDEDDLPAGSVFLPKPYRGAHVVATLRELTSAHCSGPVALLKFFAPLLKPNPVLLIHSSPPCKWRRAVPSGARAETGTGRVRCLIPILLFGGFGYAHL